MHSHPDLPYAPPLRLSYDESKHRSGVRFHGAVGSSPSCDRVIEYPMVSSCSRTSYDGLGASPTMISISPTSYDESGEIASTLSSWSCVTRRLTSKTGFWLRFPSLKHINRSLSSRLIAERLLLPLVVSLLSNIHTPAPLFRTPALVTSGFAYHTSPRSSPHSFQFSLSDHPRCSMLAPGLLLFARPHSSPHRSCHSTRHAALTSQPGTSFMISLSLATAATFLLYASLSCSASMSGTK